MGYHVQGISFNILVPAYIVVATAGFAYYTRESQRLNSESFLKRKMQVEKEIGRERERERKEN